MKTALRMVTTLFMVTAAVNGFAGELVAVDKALPKIFKNASGFRSNVLELTDEQIKQLEKKAGIIFKDTHLRQLTEYEATNGEEIIGYAYEDTVMGKWGPIHYLLGLDVKGSILDVVILGYQEIRGKPIAKKRYLRQYKGKTVNDPLTLRRDIDGVTGATISSRALTDGIRKLVHIFQEKRGE